MMDRVAMNQLIQDIRADLATVEQQQQTATHAGDHVDASDYENIALGMKRALAKVEAAHHLRQTTEPFITLRRHLAAGEMIQVSPALLTILLQ